MSLKFILTWTATNLSAKIMNTSFAHLYIFMSHNCLPTRLTNFSLICIFSQRGNHFFFKLLLYVDTFFHDIHKFEVSVKQNVQIYGWMKWALAKLFSHQSVVLSQWLSSSQKHHTSQAWATERGFPIIPPGPAKFVCPMRSRSIWRAANRPSLIAQTTRDWPRRQSETNTQNWIQ